MRGFEPIGQSGMFMANPAIVKFAGYDLKKTHTIKLKIKNQSKFPKRMHFLPPATQFFKIKHNMRGLLRAGQIEDIYVQFTPGDQFKYFYDSIRIHAEGDKIIIPLHAFPIINQNFRALLPKIIDIGRVHIGQIYQKELFIESTCPITFEYNIKEVKGHPDITLITP